MTAVGSGLQEASQRDAGIPAPLSREAPAQLVELPPYLWEKAGTPWRYASVPGYEILSRCPDEVSEQFMAEQHRLHTLLAALLPAPLRGQLTGPAIYVLLDHMAPPAEAGAVEEQLQRELAENNDNAPVVKVHFSAGQRLWDHDSLASCFIPGAPARAVETAELTQPYLRYLMEREAPALPLWFIEGTLELFKATDLAVLAGAEPAGRSDIVTFHALGQDRLVGSARPSTAGAQSKAVFLPLAVLFADRMVDLQQESDRRQWTATAALFIRWALDPRESEPPAKGSSADANEKIRGANRLWRMLESAGGRQIDETLFLEWFDLTFDEANVRLAHYAAAGMQTDFKVRIPAALEPPVIAFRPASGLEISRLHGELARLEANYVSRSYPSLEDGYVAQARRIFSQAYDAGDRDPRLLASLAFLECEAGRDSAARPLLLAIAGKIPRSRIHYELARIEYQSLLGTYADGRFPLDATTHLFDQLATARRNPPPLPEVYELIIESWLRCAGRLDARQFAVMDEGVRLFPRDSRLIYVCAMLSAVNQHHDRARAFVEHGLRVTANEATRAQLLKLATAIELEAPARRARVEGSERRRPLDTDVTIKLKPPVKAEVVPRNPLEREQVTQLTPFTVQEVFPSIDVNFTLSGENLFDTLQDSIEEARVSYVQGGGAGEKLGIEINDVLLNLNGTPIRGLTIQQLAARVAEGRKSGNLIWLVRRNGNTFTVRHNGKWETPLPAAP